MYVQFIWKIQQKYNKKIILATKHDPLKEQTVSVLKRDEESTFKYILLPDGILRPKPDGAPNGLRQSGLFDRSSQFEF